MASDIKWYYRDNKLSIVLIARRRNDGTMGIDEINWYDGETLRTWYDTGAYHDGNKMDWAVSVLNQDPRYKIGDPLIYYL